LNRIHKFIKTAVQMAVSISLVIGLASPANAAPRGGTGGIKSTPSSARAPTASRTPTLAPKTAFNRNVYSGASGLKPGVLNRAHRVADGLKQPGGARAMGLRSHGFKNDGRSGTARLPTVTAKGQRLTYQTTYMRPGGHARASSSMRLVTGSDGRAYVTRHYRDFKRTE
jgi:hypothetical protein